jgi:hypothetical protein
LRKNINKLKDILLVFKDKKRFRELEPVEFEYMISQCLKIINDEIEIKPNCVLDDEGNPISFAPGNKADIEGYYASFNSIIEATLDVSRHQVYKESIPVMRHLRNFENNNQDKPSFCIFIAPRIHKDTINYFWISSKYGFEGKRQKIVALELGQLINILKVFIRIVEGRGPFTHQELKHLLEAIVSEVDRKESSVKWYEEIPIIIDKWERSIS